MVVERVSFGTSPEKITSASYDCVWIHLAPRKAPRPLKSPALQWLDWKLSGQITRVVATGKTAGGTTFLPTMKRLTVPYLAIQSVGKHDWDAFFKNCEGMKLKRVLLFCEDAEELEKLERELRSRKTEAFPEALALDGGSEASA